MKRKTGTIFLALVIPALLWGCTEDKPERNEETTVLTYMAVGSGNNSYIGKSVMDQVQDKFPNVKIEALLYSEEQYYTVLKARLATGNGPDLFSIQPGYAGATGVISLAEAGYLEPVTELECIRERLGGEGTRKLLTSSGEVYSVSFGTMALGVLYNKELFDRYCISVPNCWEEFLECCEKLKQHGIQPLIQGSRNVEVHQKGLYQIAVNRLYEKNPDYEKELREGKAKFTDQDTWDEVLEMYTGLYDKGYLQPDTVFLYPEEASRKLNQGEAAMMFEIGSPIGNNNFGFFPLPGNDRGKKIRCSIGEMGGVGIYSGTEHMELCKEILNEVVWPVTETERENVENGFEDYGPSSFYTVDGNYDTESWFPPCNQEWINEVEIVLEEKLGEYITGHSITILDITKAMQAELEK